MKKLNYVIIAIVFALVFQACSDDKEPVIKISSFTYSTDSYVVFNTTGGESIKPELLPADASVSYHIESISKDGASFADENSVFEVDSDGVVIVNGNESLEPGEYIVNVKASNTVDTNDVRTVKLTFTVTEIVKLTNVTYGEESYDLANDKALTIEAPIIEPQGMAVKYSLTISKEGTEITTDAVQINEVGAITIAKDHKLEIGVYDIVVKTVNAEDDQNYIDVSLVLNVYPVITSITYSELSYTIYLSKELTSVEPTIDPTNGKVSYSITEVRKDDNVIDESEFIIDEETGIISLPSAHTVGLGEYKISVAATNIKDDENIVNASIEVIVIEEVEGFYYERDPYMLASGTALQTKAAKIEAGEWTFTIKDVVTYDIYGMAPPSSVVGHSLTIQDDGAVVVPETHNLNGYYRVIIKAQNEDGNILESFVWLTPQNPRFIDGEYIDWEISMMGSETLTQGEEKTYILDLFPNNLPGIKYELETFNYTSGGIVVDLENPSQYGFFLNEKTGDITFLEGHTTPKELYYIQVKITYDGEVEGKLRGGELKIE